MPSDRFDSSKGIAVEVEIFNTPDEVILEAAKIFTQQVVDSAKTKDRVSVALSGGSTPKKLHALLADRTKPFFAQIPWEKVYFFWGDERFVPPTDKDSNFRMADETLLKPAGVKPDHYFATPTEFGSPEECALRYQKTIQSFFHLHDRSEAPKFDLIILGLGTNAHTASLFPHMNLGELDSPFLKDTWVKSFYIPELKAMRLTFTPRLINSALNVMFIAVGADKHDAFKKVNDPKVSTEEAPAKLIQPKEGVFTWVVDQALAGSKGN